MKQAVKTIARYAFSIAVFSLILYLFDANDVLATIKRGDLVTLSAAVIFSLGAYFLGAVRLKALLELQDAALSLTKVFFIGLSAVFYGLVIPGGMIAAFTIRFMQLSRDLRIESVAAALLVDRVIATILLIVVGAMAVAIDRAGPLWLGIITAASTAGIAVFMIGLRLSGQMFEWLDKVSSSGPPGVFRGAMMRIGNAFSNYSSVGYDRILVLLAMSLVAHLSGCLAYYVIASGLGLNISFVSICWVRSGMIFSTMIPVSVAGLGLREIAGIALLYSLGVDEAEAVGFSIMILITTQVILGLIGGAGELARRTMSH